MSELSITPLARAGALIINADDWGRDTQNTDRTLECIVRGTVSSVSAMTFMADSERSTEIALDRGIDAGLHLNFTTPFSGSNASQRLGDHQRKLTHYLLNNRMAQVIFHPGLVDSFEYVVAAQLEEYHRLYGAKPERIDGHHHMHLCANVLLRRLLPVGTVVRRNFSFRSGEKSLVNRAYRRLVDRSLAKRHDLPDFLFSLPPLETDRLRRIFSAGRESVVELETHPIRQDEFRFLMSGEVSSIAGDLQVENGFVAPLRRCIERRIEKRLQVNA